MLTDSQVLHMLHEAENKKQQEQEQKVQRKREREKKKHDKLIATLKKEWEKEQEPKHPLATASKPKPIPSKPSKPAPKRAKLIHNKENIPPSNSVFTFDPYAEEPVVSGNKDTHKNGAQRAPTFGTVRML